MLDDLLGDYVDWRESARAVEDAYARWSFASGPERAVRFAAYTATLAIAEGGHMPGARWGARMAPHSQLRSSAKAPTSSIASRPKASPRLQADRGLRRVRASSLALSGDDRETSPSSSTGVAIARAWAAAAASFESGAWAQLT
jgi:hypothetical protein